MNKNTPNLIISLTDIPEPPSKPDIDPIGSNIGNILAFYSREDKTVTPSQRMLEAIINSLGQPFWLGAIMLFVILWIVVNFLMNQLGTKPFDEPPLHWLQGIIGLAALLIMIVILIKQNRHDKIEERRAHLELQVNLLTEQKTTKLINLMEELRRDLPMIKDRYDPELAAFQRTTDPEAVLAALDEHINTEEEKSIKSPN